MEPWLRKVPINLADKISRELNINFNLLVAMISKESNGQASATRFEPKFKWFYEVEQNAGQNRISIETEENLQKTSFGLLQIMGATARGLGYSGYLTDLCKPHIGIYWGALYLKKQLEKYSDMKDAIAAYNAGSPEKDENGKYKNQSYVNDVVDKLNYLNRI